MALGAAVREGDSALSMLVFLAIMLHKAPSSFGLASYLLHHGITPEGVKRRLLLFSSAAPLGAFCTYMLLSMSILPYKQVRAARPPPSPSCRPRFPVLSRRTPPRSLPAGDACHAAAL